MPQESPVAIVTAASKGMGEAVARELARRGYQLCLFARSDAVHALAGELGATALAISPRRKTWNGSSEPR